MMVALRHIIYHVTLDFRSDCSEGLINEVAESYLDTCFHHNLSIHEISGSSRKGNMIIDRSRGVRAKTSGICSSVAPCNVRSINFNKAVRHCGPQPECRVPIFDRAQKFRHLEVVYSPNAQGSGCAKCSAAPPSNAIVRRYILSSRQCESLSYWQK